jgi:hypothetical protein
MSEYPLTLEEIVSWFRSREEALAESGISLAEVRQNREHVPSAAADFDTANAIGRINAWAAGHFDFEVLRRADGKDVFFRHEKVLSVHELGLESAYADFLRHMLNPDEPGRDDQSQEASKSPPLASS